MNVFSIVTLRAPTRFLFSSLLRNADPLGEEEQVKMDARLTFPDLGTRLISGAILLGAAGVALWLGGLVWAGFLCLISAVMVWEVLDMQGINPWLARFVGGLTAALLFLWFHSGGVALLSVILGGFLLFSAGAVRRGAVNFCLTFGSFIAICAASVALFCIRESSLFMLIFLLTCVVASDIGGYFIGRAVGGAKLWVRVSPNKTWSGTIGGWGLALVLAGVFMVMPPMFSESIASLDAGFQGGAWLFPAALVFAISAQAGDLAQSAMKRHFGVKDSSNLLPGHGGLFDRFDGMIGAALIAGIAIITGVL